MKYLNQNHFNYLLGIYNRMSCLKKTSFKLLLYKILQIGKNKKITASDILLEYNQNKLIPAEKIFGKKLFFFNPDNLIVPIKFKLFLFIVLFLPQKYKDIVYALVLYQILSELIDSNAKLYFWNPYSTWHYCFSMLDNYKAVYVHACAYPIFRADSYFSSKFILEVYSLDKFKYTELTPSHSFRDDRRAIKFYFTQLPYAAKSKSENFLADFAKFLIKHKKRTDVEIYLHYSDRENKEIDISKTFLAGLENFVSFEKSLNNLSKNQLSFSAKSSIGFELLSLKINHYIFVKDDLSISQYPELLQFIKQSDRFITISESFEEIYQRMNI